MPFLFAKWKDNVSRKVPNQRLVNLRNGFVGKSGLGNDNILSPLKVDSTNNAPWRNGTVGGEKGKGVDGKLLRRVKDRDELALGSGMSYNRI